MATTKYEQLELIVEALHCLQHGALRLGCDDLFHLLGVAELEAQDILRNEKPEGKCVYSAPEGKAEHLS